MKIPATAGCFLKKYGIGFATGGYNLAKGSGAMDEGGQISGSTDRDGNVPNVSFNETNQNVNVSNVNLDETNPNWSVREAVSQKNLSRGSFDCPLHPPIGHLGHCLELKFPRDVPRLDDDLTLQHNADESLENFNANPHLFQTLRLACCFFKRRLNGEFQRYQCRALNPRVDAMPVPLRQLVSQLRDPMIKFRSMMDKGYRLWLLWGGA